MANLQEICKNVADDVEGAVGFAVVDLNNGLLLGVHHTVPYFTQTYLDAVAAAAVDMFRGKNVTSVEKLLSSQRGETVQNMIQEVQMTTPGTYHFMSIVPEKPDALVVLITTRKANLGMGWSALRNALPDIAPQCP